MSPEPRLILYFTILSLLLSAEVSAQQLIKISQSAWLMLTPVEREFIQKKHIVDLIEQDAFGTIIDNQGINESTSGTSSGAILGSAVANAAYVDNVIKGGNYSAINQLAVGILGAVLGSTLDSKPNPQYHFRYAVRLESGSVKYFDEIKSDPFRHPVGVCVSVPSISLLDQELCTQTGATLKAKYVNIPVAQTVGMPSVLAISTNNEVEQKRTKNLDNSSIQVDCKLGDLGLFVIPCGT